MLNCDKEQNNRVILKIPSVTNLLSSCASCQLISRETFVGKPSPDLFTDLKKN